MEQDIPKGILNSESPIDGIPVELLQIIFEDCVDWGMSVWSFTQVSRKWKQIAFSTPTLWSDIKIIDANDWTPKERAPEDDGIEAYYIGKTHICSNVTQLKGCLSRCPGVPLDISIYCRLWAKDIVECLKVLIVPSITQRFRSLFFHVSSNAVEKALPECFEQARLPNIESLTMNCLISSTFVTGIFNAMSKPTPPSQISESSSLFNPTDAPWPRLKRLDFCRGSTPGQFNEIAHGISKVSSIGPIPRMWPDNQTPRVTFSNLISVSVATYPCDFRRLQWPRLEKPEVMDWGSPKFFENSFPEFSSFPALKNF
ncbi:hypothetical protein CPB86DRAFT_787740 [Serendipita vermifera]|nr:hypothetical protein CPB86DRAFT_787740 [Serendipita vermifera]